MSKKETILQNVSEKLKNLYKRHVRIIPGIRSYVIATALVFILGMAVTTFSWYVDRQRVAALSTAEFNDQKSAIESDIKNRLVIYEQILRGVSGYINATGTISNANLNGFVQQYDIAKNYPGVAGVGYVELVPAAGLDTYLDKMRSEGYANIAITPAGDRSEYAPLTYSYPGSEEGKKFVGFDILTEPVRAEQAQRTRDSGMVGLSQKTTLVTDAAKNSTQPGFNMYMAIYKKGSDTSTVDARRQNVSGYIYSSYRANTLFSQAIDKDTMSAYKQIQIFDGKSTDQSALLYQTADFSTYDASAISQTFETTVFDRTWTIRLAEPANSSLSDSQRSNMILIGGTTISFAMAGFLFLVMLTRARAIVYSKQNEAQQAKDDLLSLASHQLRTPATAVKQYLGMILEGYTGRVSKKQLPALQKAYASNERQLDTINQILYVAKADAGRLSINPSKFDLHLLIDEIALDLTDMFESNDQSIVIERPAKKVSMYGDEASIRMVIENLISNASKYSYQGSKVTVRTEAKNDFVYISIHDEGVGIAADDYDKLFKKFSRIDNDLSLQVGGSGIGLYIDKVLVELHGGRIDVTSELGQGSVFTISLPQKNANNLTDGDE